MLRRQFRIMATPSSATALALSPGGVHHLNAVALGRFQDDVVHAHAEAGQNFQLRRDLKDLLVPLVHSDDSPLDVGGPDCQLLKGIIGHVVVVQDHMMSVVLQKPDGVLTQRLKVGGGDQNISHKCPSFSHQSQLAAQGGHAVLYSGSVK